jgi:hypothetical protein
VARGAAGRGGAAGEKGGGVGRAGGTGRRARRIGEGEGESATVRGARWVERDTARLRRVLCAVCCSMKSFFFGLPGRLWVSCICDGVRYENNFLFVSVTCIT